MSYSDPLPPFAITIALPFCLAFGWSGLMIYRGSRRRGPAMAELGMGLGFLGGYVALTGGLPFLDDLPNAVIGKIALLLLLPAALLTLWLPGPRVTRWLVALVAAAATLWIARGAGFDFATLADMAVTAAALAASLAIAFRLQALGQGSAVPVLILCLVAASLAGIAYIAQAPVFTGLFTSLTTALAGFLFWCRPFAKRPVGAAGLILSLTLLLVLAQGFWRDAVVTPWSLVIVAGAFWSDRIVERMPVLARRSRRRTERPGLLIAVAVLCCLVGLGLAALVARYHLAA